jgi:hypothetical protein
MDGEERGRWLDRNPPTRTWYPSDDAQARLEGRQIDEQHTALPTDSDRRRSPGLED